MYIFEQKLSIGSLGKMHNIKCNYTVWTVNYVLDQLDIPEMDIKPLRDFLGLHIKTGIHINFYSRRDYVSDKNIIDGPPCM